MRTRREQLTAQQLMRENPTEAIVDKDNHLRDALKYILLSLPSPSERPKEMRREEIIKQAFEDGTYATLGVQMARFDSKETENLEPVSYRQRWPCESDQCRALLGDTACEVASRRRIRRRMARWKRFSNSQCCRD
jgi:hypothetical protein